MARKDALPILLFKNGVTAYTFKLEPVHQQCGLPHKEMQIMNRFRDSIYRYSTTAAMLAVLLLGGTLLAGNSAVAGEATPMNQMAEIMHRLKH